jgi:hypothetical protein
MTKMAKQNMLPRIKRIITTMGKQQIKPPMCKDCYVGQMMHLISAMFIVELFMISEETLKSKLIFKKFAVTHGV